MNPLILPEKCSRIASVGTETVTDEPITHAECGRPTALRAGALPSCATPRCDTSSLSYTISGVPVLMHQDLLCMLVSMVEILDSYFARTTISPVSASTARCSSHQALFLG